MSVEALILEERRSPRGSARYWGQVYEGIATRFNSQDDPFPFLNLGFLVADTHVVAADPLAWDRLAEGLYDRALEGVGLSGRVVLEVGCGRGGGSAHMAETTVQPTEVVGLDLSASSIEWCSQMHVLSNLSFRHGDAMSLPFSANSFDVIVNVESAHCYPSRAGFFQQVKRALRPGGTFVFADLFLARPQQKTSQAVEAELSEAGLRIESFSNITQGVLASRDLLAKSQAFDDRLARILPDREARDGFRRLAHLAGTPAYRALAEGKTEYLCWQALG